MSFNLIDAAKGLFTNELIGKASSFLGESETGVTKAVTGIVPTLLSGLMNKVSSHEGAGAVANMVEEQKGGLLDNLGGFFGGDNGSLLNKGAGLLSGLFGNKADGITSLISNFAGIKSSSSSSLLSMALPAVLGLVGKHAGGGASGIASLFSSQKDNIAAAIPSGLNLSSVLGNTASHTAAKAVHHTTETVENNSGGAMKILLPALLLVLLGAAVWYFTKDGCGKSAGHDAGAVVDTMQNKVADAAGAVKETVTAAIGKLDTLTGEWIYDAGEMATIDLPNNGGKLTVGKNSTEYKLVNFLNDKNAIVDTAKGNWFEFTNVRFKTGSSDIVEASMTQLTNMVAIAKAYPSAQFKLGGYTDNTGNAAANVALSQKRADAVVAMLKKLGAAAASITGAKGYGPEWPIASNDTPEGRAQNRRVAVNVKAK